MTKRLIVAAVAAAALVVAGSASAITGGQLDVDAHPNVGAMMFEDPSAGNSLQLGRFIASGGYTGRSYTVFGEVGWAIPV